MKKKQVRFLLNLCICILLLFLIIELGEKVKIYQDGKQEEERKEVYQELSLMNEDSASKIDILRKQFANDQILGILSIPSTSFKTAFVQGDDNSYYLSHALDKTTSIYGTAFLDYRVNLDSEKLLIYGHNAESFETEFQFLLNYLDHTFYLAHPIITLETDKGIKEFEIFSVMILPSDSEEHAQIDFKGETKQAQIAWAKEHSLYNTNTSVEDEQILVLQTCNFKPKNTYFVIYSKEK